MYPLSTIYNAKNSQISHLQFGLFQLECQFNRKQLLIRNYSLLCMDYNEGDRHLFHTLLLLYAVRVRRQSQYRSTS
jgi:hypothetical protein